MKCIALLYYSLCRVRSSQVEDIVRRNAKQSPYFLITSFPARQVFLIVDKSVVCECSVEDVPVMLMSTFFHSIFVILLGAITTLLFWSVFQIIVLQNKLPASVKHLLAALSMVLITSRLFSHYYSNEVLSYRTLCTLASYPAKYSVIALCTS